MAYAPTIFTARFSEDVRSKLDYLAELNGMTRNGYLTWLICAEYDRVRGNPELLEASQKLRDLTSGLSAIASKLGFDVRSSDQ